MKRFVLLLLLLSLGGCAAVKSSGTGQSPSPTSSSPSEQSPAAALSPISPQPDVTELSPAPTVISPAATRTPGGAISTAGPTAIATPETPSSVARIPPLSPTVGASTGWKTFASAGWHVAVDYPPDWTVDARSTSAVFTSPQGVAIILTLVDGGPLSTQGFPDDLPNTRCTSRTNSHGITARVCLDTIAFSYSAEFVVKWPEGEQMLSMWMGRRGNLGVFDSMIASLRPAP